MNRTRLALTLLLTGLAVPSASAQLRYVRPQTNPYGTPTVSPYLNIASGLNPAISYYGIVRPTLQFQQFEQTVIGPGGTLSMTCQTSTGIQPYTTGASSVFSGYSGYFGNVMGQRIGTPAPPPGYSGPVPPAAVPVGRR